MRLWPKNEYYFRCCFHTPVVLIAKLLQNSCIMHLQSSWVESSEFVESARFPTMTDALFCPRSRSFLLRYMSAHQVRLKWRFLWTSHTSNTKDMTYLLADVLWAIASRQTACNASLVAYWLVFAMRLRSICMVFLSTSVCPSVRPSVCQMRVLWQNEITVCKYVNTVR